MVSCPKCDSAIDVEEEELDDLDEHFRIVDVIPRRDAPPKEIPGLIDRLRQLLGPSGILTDPADTDPYCEDWRRLYHGRTPAVLRPARPDLSGSWSTANPAP